MREGTPEESPAKEEVMQFGVSMFVTDTGMRPDDLAREVEARGFESLWMPEHTHIPADRKGPTGDALPEHYWRSYDPFVALTAAAMVTTRLKVGTGVCLVIERDPIITAKEVASLDFLSGGRFMFGIGGGWNEQEMRDHGTDPKTRFALLRDRILAMKAIWTQDEPEYHGRFVDFDRILSYPKPVQKPHPPILLGSHGPRAIDRVIEYCDGWFPIVGRVPGELEASVANLRQRAEAAGRDPRTLSVSTFMSPTEPSFVERAHAMELDRVIYALPSAPRDQVLPILDRYVSLAGLAQAQCP